MITKLKKEHLGPLNRERQKLEKRCKKLQESCDALQRQMHALDDRIAMQASRALVGKKVAIRGSVCGEYARFNSRTGVMKRAARGWCTVDFGDLGEVVLPLDFGMAADEMEWERMWYAL